MTATSVTGMGLGSADKKQKGSEHLSIGANKLIGPRIVAAGTVTLSGGAATVTLPALNGTSSQFVVMCTDVTGAHAVSASLVVTAGTSTVITFAGTSTDVLAYTVVKTGLAV